MASRSLTFRGRPHSSILLPNLERLKSTNRQENTMQDRCFRGPIKPSSLHHYLVPVAFWRPQLRRLRHPLQDVFLRCVMKFFQHLDNMVIGGRGFCRSKCLSCFQAMRGGNLMRTLPTVWLRSHPPYPKTNTYIKTKWARASSSPVRPHHYPKAACVPPREWIPLKQLFHVCDISLPTRLCPFFKRPKFGLCPKRTTDFFKYVARLEFRTRSLRPIMTLSLVSFLMDQPESITPK